MPFAYCVAAIVLICSCVRVCCAVAISVINGIQTSDIANLFNPENIFISKEGGGAGNNWASGFTQGEQVQETLLDMIGEAAAAGWCLSLVKIRYHPASWTPVPD